MVEDKLASDILLLDIREQSSIADYFVIATVYNERQAGAIDGLSIGYRTVRSAKNDSGQRMLTEVELWEVSLVTFPMLPEARIGAKSDDREDPSEALMRELAAVVEDARLRLASPD